MTKYTIKRNNNGRIESVNDFELGEIIWVTFTSSGPLKAEIVEFSDKIGFPMAQVKYATDRASEKVRIERLEKEIGGAREWEFTSGTAEPSPDSILEGSVPPTVNMVVGTRLVHYTVAFRYTVTEEVVLCVPVPDYYTDDKGITVAHQILNRNEAELRSQAVSTLREPLSYKVTPYFKASK